jgi:hypothetical protein
MADEAPTFRFRGRLWLYDGRAAWHFITLPHDVTDEIDELAVHSRRGFGSVRVVVTIGSTTWNTSIFPDTKAGSFVLPVKQQVRRGEQLAAEDLVDVTLQLAE